MTAMRVSMRQLLVATAFVAVGLFVWLNPYMFLGSPGRRYQTTRELMDLRESLVYQVRNGDTYEEVSAIIGPGRTYSRAEARSFFDRVIRKGKAAGSFVPGFAPDAADTIVSYSSNKQLAFLLIFREGRLVNHDPSRYDKL
ncbi:MAG: hypothetical protein Aurels2KO_53520 [Aureliella sp.]